MEIATMSQTRLILSHLIDGRSITALEALELYKCLRLSARIYDIKQKGFEITGNMITSPGGKKVKEYKLRNTDK